MDFIFLRTFFHDFELMPVFKLCQFSHIFHMYSCFASWSKTRLLIANMKTTSMYFHDSSAESSNPQIQKADIKKKIDSLCLNYRALLTEKR